MPDFNPEAINALMDAELEKNKVPTTVTATPEAAAAAETKIEDKKEPQTATVETKSELTELLKKYNVTTVEELDALVSKPSPKVETEEEKQAREKAYLSNIDKYAQDNGIMSREDIIKYETLKSKQDAELVFEKYLSDWKELNPDAAPEDIEALAKADFESDYKLNSENEKAKSKGLDRLSKEANEIRNPYITKYETAKNNYDAEQNVKATLPTFHKYLKDNIAATIKDEIKVFEKKIDEKTVIPFNVKLDEKDKQEIIEAAFTEFNRLPYFNSFTNAKETANGRNEWIERNLQNFIEVQVNKKYGGSAYDSIWNKAAEYGKAQGSTAGATVPFALNQNRASGGNISPVDAEQAMLESLQYIRKN